MNKKLFLNLRALLALAALLYVIAPKRGSAWARHNLMTHIATGNSFWLHDYQAILVTKSRFLDESLNPDFFSVFVNNNYKQRLLTPLKFVYYDATPDNRYGFQGADLGTETSAHQVLADFSDEPDWGMDQNLNLAWSQKFMGGSQGYRHMYYPPFSLHIPRLFLKQGKAPDRIKHFYELAGQAFADEDYYWGFRFLARALHYLQDLAQPYHTSQTCWSFIKVNDPIKFATATTKNYHFAYESLVARVLELEAGNRLKFNDYHQALYDAPAISANTLKELIQTVVKQSRSLAAGTFKASQGLFGERLMSNQPVKLSEKTALKLVNLPRDHSQRREFDHQVTEALKIVSGATKSFLDLAFADFIMEK